MNAVRSKMSLKLRRLAVTIGRLVIGHDVNIRTILLILAHGIQRRVVIVGRRLALRVARDFVS